MFDELKRNLIEEKLCAVATLLNGARIGAKLIVYPDARVSGDLGDAALTTQVTQDALEALRRETSEHHAYDEIAVFIEVCAPQPRLVIIGGVHAAMPLTQFAQTLGFRVTIVDGRGRFANRERFPTADEIIVAWPQEALAQMQIDASTYIAILTHDPKFDIPALIALARTNPRYIGALGSRETRAQHFAELRARGVAAEFLARVHAPIGLDVGARTPEEIALAILAEIIAVRYERPAGFLK